MRRQALDDGRWFNLEAAESWAAAPAVVDGDPLEREELYRTDGGSWVLRRVGLIVPRDTWTEVDVKDATSWLVRNGHEPPGDLAEALANLEVP